MKKIMTIIGARPQIIKAAAISRAISDEYSTELKEILVHTGQHYDQQMSETFFDELGIPKPDYNLAVGSGSHGEQTAKMISGLEQIIQKEQPNAVLVYGDTNSTLAGAIAASKLHVPVVHVEAGLRSFNKRMPEEINRIACDHVSTLLFCPTAEGISNLRNEGFKENKSSKADIDTPKVYHCGDIMYDNSLHFAQQADKRSVLLNSLGLKPNDYVLVTIHRDSNTDNPTHLQSIFEGLLSIVETSGKTLVLPLHPRTRKKLEELTNADLKHAISSNPKLMLIEPASFLDMIALEKGCYMVITDSGGVQKEAYFFEKPCIILREQTEWVELVSAGNAILVGSNKSKIERAFEVLSQKNEYKWPSFFGDGRAARFICERLIAEL
jgi:UDP-GlcNAc3NAcA epimerase